MSVVQISYARPAVILDEATASPWAAERAIVECRREAMMNMLLLALRLNLICNWLSLGPLSPSPFLTAIASQGCDVPAHRACCHGRRMHAVRIGGDRCHLSRRRTRRTDVVDKRKRKVPASQSFATSGGGEGRTANARLPRRRHGRPRRSKRTYTSNLRGRCLPPLSPAVRSTPTVRKPLPVSNLLPTLHYR